MPALLIGPQQTWEKAAKSKPRPVPPSPQIGVDHAVLAAARVFSACLSHDLAMAQHIKPVSDLGRDIHLLLDQQERGATFPQGDQRPGSNLNSDG